MRGRMNGAPRGEGAKKQTRGKETNGKFGIEQNFTMTINKRKCVCKHVKVASHSSWLMYRIKKSFLGYGNNHCFPPFLELWNATLQGTFFFLPAARDRVPTPRSPLAVPGKIG